MFDVGASELLLIVVVAIVVIGPKDMPLALRTAGRWIGKMRRMSAHFRAGIDAMVREAELEEMERKWREQNDAIMRAHPGVEAVPDAEAMMAPIAAPGPAAAIPPPVPVAPDALPGPVPAGDAQAISAPESASPPPSPTPSPEPVATNPAGPPPPP